MVFKGALSQHIRENTMLQIYAGIGTLALVFLLLEITFQNDPACNRTGCYFISFGFAGAMATIYTHDTLLQFLFASGITAIAIGISRVIRKKSSEEIDYSEFDRPL